MCLCIGVFGGCDDLVGCVFVVVDVEVGCCVG